MKGVTETERETYEEAWSLPQYAVNAPGEQYAPLFLELVKGRCEGLGSVLDAGAGSGKGAIALKAAGFAVTLCDLTDEGLVDAARGLPFIQRTLWHPLVPATGYHDWVYCTDVLEHIPTEYTMLVVQRLLDVARRGVFLAIYTRPDGFGDVLGTPLHRTVQDFSWWKSRLEELGTVVEARDLINEVVFLVKPDRWFAKGEPLWPRCRTAKAGDSKPAQVAA